MVEKQEITAGLKQAVEKGYNLELVKKSFINAGYNKEDIEDSAKPLMGISGNFPEMMPTTRMPVTAKMPPVTPSQNPAQIPQKPISANVANMPSQNISSPIMTNTYLQPAQVKNKKMTVFIIILIIVLVLLLGVLGASLFWKDQVLEILSNWGIQF